MTRGRRARVGPLVALAALASMGPAAARGDDAATSLPSREPYVQVGLIWDQDSLVLVPAGGGQWRGSPSGKAVPAGARVTMALTTDGFAASWSQGGTRMSETFGARDTAWLIPVRRGDTTTWDGRSWRGEMKLFLSPRGKLTLADRLPLETYLLGVVPLEIGGLKDSVVEAGRAQAIAARSYTLFYMGRRGDEGFDLYGTVEDQVYGSVESERPMATHCVTQTRGRVALYRGAPIRANYCSTCGGITADVWEAWPTPPLDYLRGRLDTEGGGEAFCRPSPRFRWRQQWSADDFVEMVRRTAPPSGVTVPPGWPGRLLDVHVADRSRSGRVKTLIISGTAGDLTVPNHVLRQVLRQPTPASPILSSNLFKLGVRRDVTDGRVVSVVVSGAGSGHGVGLCQVGALGMARQGYTADQILTHYYSGIELKTLYH